MKLKTLLVVTAFMTTIALNAYAEKRQISGEYPFNGSTLSIRAVADSSQLKRVNKAIAQIGKETTELYNRLIYNELEEINKTGKKRTLVLSADMFVMISEAVKLAHQTDGWFDIVTNSKSSFAFTSKDWRRVKLDRKKNSLTFKSKGLKLNLGKFAMAFIVDQACEKMVMQGYSNFSVCVDNSICKSKGRDIHTPWLYELRYGGGEYAKKANRYWVSNISYAEVTQTGLGKGLIDAKSGKEVNPQLKSATALAKKATTATAIALASYSLGTKSAYAFIRRHPEIKAVLVTSDEELLTSLGMDYKRPDYTKEKQTQKDYKNQGPSDIRLRKKEENK